MLSRASVEYLGHVSCPEECGGDGGAAEVCGTGADMGDRAAAFVSEASIFAVSIARSM